jgi:localization factor PodJL
MVAGAAPGGRAVHGVDGAFGRTIENMAAAPWSVKGIDPEAREAAKLAARRAGMTLGEWLTQTIRAAAADELKRGLPAVPVPLAQPQAGAALSQAATSGTERAQPQSPARDPESSGQPPAPTIQAMFERIQSLSKRLESSEERAGKLVTPLQAQIDTLSQEIDRLKSQAGVSTAPVERAVTRLSERLQRLEDDHAGDGKRGPFGLLKSK